jgi:hypothetical protein
MKQHLRYGATAIPLLSVLLFCTASGTVARWGRDGHIMTGLAAASELPEDMPTFFREAKDQLGWLNYDPDRWRNDAMVESNQAFQYDHFIDLERVPDAALAKRSRFEYLIALSKAGIERPENMGLLPFRIMELEQRLEQEFRQWRQATDARERAWIEARVINDAGILGHYVADGANPHHATIHFNGWDAGTANPQGYTTDRTFHRRFESDYVSAHIRLEDVLAQATAPAKQLPDVRADVIAYIRKTGGLVRTLYELEKQEPFSATTKSESHKVFVVARLAAAAEMLRSVWYTAWRASASP